MEKTDVPSFEQALEYFSSFGKKESGAIDRVFGSRVYQEAAQALRKYFEQCGMDSWIDSVGNVHGIYRNNTDASQQELMIGSHLDTVKGGGIFDGLLGVLAGAECVKRIKENAVSCPIALHILATNGEEGNELGGTFGSRCLVGQVDWNQEFASKAKKYGFTQEKIEQAKLPLNHVIGYLELHIEQGSTLFQNHETIGIVTGIVGLQRYRIDICGKQNHAGTTMMKYRNDALVKASKIIAEGDQLARELGHDLVTTFSKVKIHPNQLAIINDEVEMVLECRNQSESLMEEFIHCLKKRFQNNDIKWTCLVKKKPVKCNEQFVERLKDICQNKGALYRKMASGATHDGNMMALKVPIGMIFVPSKEGLSHCKEEWTEISDCKKGIEVLYECVVQIEKEGCL